MIDNVGRMLSASRTTGLCRTLLPSRMLRQSILLCGLLAGAALHAQTHLPVVAGEAQKAQAAGDSSKAMQLYAQALQQAPGWTEGWWRYGGLLYEDHQFEQARGAFARLTELAPENPLGFALLGLCEYELADWNNASLHLNKALSHGGLPAEIANSSMYHFGLTLLRQHNRNGALILFRFLFHAAPQYPHLSLALGAAELGLEQLPADGTPAFEAATLAGQAAVAVIEVKPDDADRLYRQLVTQFPDQPDAHLSLGLFLENEHRDDEASKEFLAETKVNPQSEAPWIWLARVALAQKDTAATRTDVEQARRLRPEDPLCDLIEGRSYVLDKDWNKALPLLQKAETGAPQSDEVHFALATVYAALHREEQAAAERKLFLDITAKNNAATQGAKP